MHLLPSVVCFLSTIIIYFEITLYSTPSALVPGGGNRLYWKGLECWAEKFMWGPNTKHSDRGWGRHQQYDSTHMTTSSLPAEACCIERNWIALFPFVVPLHLSQDWCLSNSLHLPNLCPYCLFELSFYFHWNTPLSQAECDLYLLSHEPSYRKLWEGR